MITPQKVEEAIKLLATPADGSKVNKTAREDAVHTICEFAYHVRKLAIGNPTTQASKACNDLADSLYRIAELY